MKTYRLISLTLMVLFAATGILFLTIPENVLLFFNDISLSLGMLQSPISGWSLYLVLAAGYMYMVTVLSFLMFKHPANHYFPLLLTQAKLVSSFLSLALFIIQAPYLVYLVNFVIDGIIGLVVFMTYRMLRRGQWAYS